MKRTLIATIAGLYLISCPLTMASIPQSEEDSVEIFLDNLINAGKYAEAKKLLDDLEKKYIPEALYLKGIAYLNGLYNDGERNPREATIYFAKAAALKYPPAIAALADSYLDGDGSAQDEAEAFRLYKQAAELGDGSAQFNVAILYRDGIGTKRSPQKAIQYLMKAKKGEHTEHLVDEIDDIINDIKDELKSKKK